MTCLEIVEFNNHRLELEASEVLESQGRIQGTFLVGEGRCWVQGERLSFEVRYSGHSSFFAGKEIEGFTSFVTEECGTFVRINKDVFDFCLLWAASKNESLKHEAIVALYKHGRDSLEFRLASLKYWESQNPERVVFSATNEGLPIVGINQTTVREEIAYLREQIS